ncbi:uncharacterized protein LOC105446589 [Strongylocentrotus purpuratus]|uniref:Uncharacterized protein n=1 Tax=Strongylocentrotus purpuratus TaxID=7668 RepID=A0A7M7P3B6_STRPU|nr:uncharacterized protein LOC105446589 [Strongylocentrotus purpuratus]
MPQPRRNGGGQAPAQRRNNAAWRARWAKFKKNFTKKRSPNFHYRAGLTIGGIQLVAGILSVILSGVAVTFYHWDVIGYPSVGVWAGIVFYIPAGILGIAAKKQHTFIIYLYMTWSIFSALVGPFMTIFEGVVAGVGSLVFACKGLLGPLFGIWPINAVVNESLCEKFGIENLM